MSLYDTMNAESKIELFLSLGLVCFLRTDHVELVAVKIRVSARSFQNLV